LADIEQGLFDVIIVYKINRLTCSLADFAWMVEIFDAHGEALASWVDRVDLTARGSKISVRVPMSQDNSKDTLKLEKQVPVRTNKCGVELVGNPPGSGARVDLVLLKAIARTMVRCVGF